jgi:hypothetical protein
LRWIASIVLTALIASAATSAVFLTVRSRPAPPPTAAQLAAIDGQQFSALAPSLLAAVQNELASGRLAPASGPKQVDVIVTVEHGEAKRVPLVSTASNMLTDSVATPWQMHIASVQEVRRFARIADIQRSSSLRQPGYIGLVELQVDRLTRVADRSGQLPATTSQEFEVITAAKYNELDESDKFERPAQTVSPAREVLLEERFVNWQPVSPVPQKLPPAISEHYHATLTECNSAEPQVESFRETICFYYDPQAGTWTPQPRGEPISSASQ